MIQDPVRRAKLKSILILAILVSIPCYLLGLVVLWINNGIKGRTTPTPSTTPTITEMVVTQPSPTLPEPATRFPTSTVTFTPTSTREVSPSATYFIPSPTPSLTPSPSDTPVPTDTPQPSTTPTTELTESTP